MRTVRLSIALLLLASPGWTDGFELSFDSLPSAQGMSYSTTQQMEGEAEVGEPDGWSVDGTTLAMNTLGTAASTVTYTLDDVSSVVNPAEPFRLSLRARVLAVEDVATLDVHAIPVRPPLLADAATEEFMGGFGLRADQVFLYSGPVDPDGWRYEGFGSWTVLDVDNTEFHTYVMVFRPADKEADFYIDGAHQVSLPMMAILPSWPADSKDRFRLGESLFFSNAQAEITQYSIAQGAGIPSVIEGSSWGQIKADPR